MSTYRRRGAATATTTENRRAGVVVLGRGADVNATIQARVALAVGTGEGDEVGGGAGAVAGDLELGAADVELRGAGRVQADVLDPHEVVAGLQAGGDGGVDLVHVDVELAARLGAVLVNLEPDVARGVPAVDVLSVGDPGHVEH